MEGEIASKSSVYIWYDEKLKTPNAVKKNLLELIIGKEFCLDDFVDLCVEDYTLFLKRVRRGKSFSKTKNLLRSLLTIVFVLVIFCSLESLHIAEAVTSDSCELIIHCNDSFTCVAGMLI